MVGRGLGFVGGLEELKGSGVFSHCLGARTITTTSSTATKPVWMSSGSATKVLKNPTISLIPTSSPQEIVEDLEAALTREVKSKKVKVKIGEEEIKR